MEFYTLHRIQVVSMGSLDALMGLRKYVYFKNYVLRPFEWDSVSLDAFNSE